MNNKKNSKTDLNLKNQLVKSKKKIQMSTNEEFFTINTYRTILRKKLKISNINIFTLVSILPFLIGFFQFIHQRYNFSKNSLIIEKNIPIFQNPSENLHWETIEYLEKQDILVDFFKKNNLYWADTSLICNTKQSNFSLFTKTNQISTIAKKSNPEILKEWYFFPLKPHTTQNWDSFYSNCDEFPAKLETLLLSKKLGKTTQLINNSNRKINFKNTNQSFKSVFSVIIENDKQSEYKQILPNFSFLKLNTKHWYKNSVNLNFLKSFTEQKNFKSIGLKNTKFENQFNEISPILKIKQNYFKKLNQFKNELQKIFLNNGEFPNLNPEITLTLDNEKRLLKWYSGKDFIQVIDDINQIYISDEFFVIRRMSGYQYPDMDISSNFWFLLQKEFNTIFSTTNLKIQVPQSLSILSNSFLVANSNSLIQKFKTPNFLVETRNLLIKNPTDSNVIYHGPGLIMSEIDGFDWKTKLNFETHRIENSKINFRNWLEVYLSKLNPFTDNFLNFSEKGSSFSMMTDLVDFHKENQPTKKTFVPIKTSSHNYWFYKNSFLQTGIISNSNASILAFERSYQLPYINQNQWDFYFQHGSSSSMIQTQSKSGTTDILETEFTEINLPLVEIRLPSQKTPKFLFGLSPLLDYHFYTNYKTEFSLTTTFVPEIFHYLNNETFGNQYTSGIYQKLLSTFNVNVGKNSFNSSTISFYDIWEPLTFRSWLLISQIGFAFLVFSILKALADNYGRELLVYLLDLVALLGFLDEDLKQEIEILMGQREKGFRIISRTSKTFKDIAGIENLLPDIIEIVWFLRNSARDFSLSKNLPRGVLLTGPPGTGKTLLVQAIAGESGVPVLALSGSSLLEPGESGALKLEILFQEARRLAPCIVFIDEIDTLAEKRQQVLQNPMGADELLESLNEKNLLKQINNSGIPNINFDTNLNIDSEDVTENSLAHQDMQREKLRILMQFLVELDGIQNRDAVVVIGATNRPEMLDSAILRPGRFDRIVELGLPGPEKRREILKLYSQNLGVTPNISWNYLVNRTSGFSAADLASIMNQSSLKAISTNTYHTVESIEHGIDRITTIEADKPKINIKNSLLPLQRAYYQAGKIILSMFLEHHPPTLVTYLWPRRSNVRALQISSNIQTYFFQFARRVELEHRLIGCYSGKAAEILFLQTTNLTNSQINLSDLGVEDIQFGQNLTQFMIQNWNLYSKNSLTNQTTTITDSRNYHEYHDSIGKITFLNTLSTKLDFNSLNQTFNISDNSSFSMMKNAQNLVSGSRSASPVDHQSQSYFSIPWWQYQISQEFEITTRLFSDWYRIYLPDPQETERNLEWIPPDEFYQSNSLLKNFSESINWNQSNAVLIEYQIHSLILQSFNESFVILEQHRELLDTLAYQLLQNEILREPEIEKIFSNFNILTPDKNKEDSSKNFFSDLVGKISSKELSKKILTYSWGEISRRQKFRWVNLLELKI